ncbi:MAG: DUF1800 domain-containing protein [Gammaproteobacteria bacterium]|nr:DUF1800 domain-containing protein [Gammaproteobacteria bacterium]
MSIRIAASLVVACATATLLASCGGGGGSESPQPPAVQSPASPPPGSGTPSVPAVFGLQDASRLASRATFGMPYEEILRISGMGAEAWLDEQLTLPYSSHEEFADLLLGKLRRGEITTEGRNIALIISFWRGAWWNRAMTAPDQVQQRVAFALSEIFVISALGTLAANPPAITVYNDLLLKGTTGNFRDLLYDIALSPAMGFYLSHVNNRRSDPANNVFPDQNFAREVMQLFSIGLYELNEDGSARLDGRGQLMPTYGNDDIREYAKVFTGLSYDGPNAYFGKRRPEYGNFRVPMRMFESEHEPGSKRLLNGRMVQDGGSGLDEVRQAIDSLFEHPNVGPFIGRQLIQRLVTSNPSPEYVGRVARAFNGETTGVRGDMKAVIRAILLDPEAWDPPNPQHSGKLREPVLRMTALARQFNAQSADGLFFNNGYRLQNYSNQHPFNAPSVFNFFSPDHSPAGELARNDLVAPEMQITTANTIVGMSNMLFVGAFVDGDLFSQADTYSKTYLDISDYVEIADDVDALIDRLDLVMTYGRLDEPTRQAIKRNVELIGDPVQRVRTAIHLFSISPAYAVED